MTVDVRDDHGASADSGADTANRVRTHVTGDEHTGHVRLRVERRSAAAALEAVAHLLGEVATTEDVTPVQGDRPVQPHGVRHGTDHREEVVGDHLLLALGRAHDDTLQLVLAHQTGDLALGVDHDVLALLDLLDEVVRHLQVQRLAAHDHVHGAVRALGQVHRRLAGAVGASDDEEFLVRVLVLQRGRSVADAVAQVGHDVGDGQPAVAHARGEHHRPREEPVACVITDAEETGLVADDAACHDGRQHLGAEPEGLLDHAVRQVLAGHTTREARVVFDIAARAGLASQTLVSVEEERPDLLAAGVDRRGQARGAATNDDKVADVHVWFHLPFPGVGAGATGLAPLVSIF